MVVVIVANETSSLSDKPCALRSTVSPASVNCTNIDVVDCVPVPTTCIPTVTPVLIAVMTVVLPTTVLLFQVATVSAPQFELTVTICPAAVDVPRPSKIDSSAVCESLHDA